jgi:capsular polysaccharide biosynthesis protein
MSEAKVIFHKSVSIRSLPINLDRADLDLFKHELEKEIPATVLRYLNNVTVSSEGFLLDGINILDESFPDPKSADSMFGIKGRIKAVIRHKLAVLECKLKRPIKAPVNSIWVTDTLSYNYFHWFTDVLPRILSVQDKLEEATLLLPGSYQSKKYVLSSLKPLPLRRVEFISKPVYCDRLTIPAHTAPTGNYNESIIRDVREIYVNFCDQNLIANDFERVYISRGKAQRRKLSNEAECIKVLEEFGFKTIHFEDYSFEQQVEMIRNARYLVSSHGSGLTNMLFMKSNGRVLELRQRGDLYNNCFFSLASVLGFKYFYQLCDSQNYGENANTANLIVDCQLLRENIQQMLDVAD